MSDSNHQSTLSQKQINSVISLFSNGQFDEALNSLKALIKLHPEVSLLHNIKGACYAGLGQLASAVKSYESAISLDPGYAKAYFNLGNVLHELNLQGLGGIDEPIASYEKSIEIDSNYAEAHNNLGNILKEIGRLDEANVCFNKAISLNPEYVEAHYSLGIVLFDLGQLESAERSYNKALTLNPNFPEAHNNLGNTLMERGQIDNAISSYQRALIINPNYIEAHSNLGNIFLENNELDNAVKSFQRALDINPNIPELYNNLGNAYKKLGHNQDALNSYSKGLSHNPESTDLLNNIGVTLNDLGQFKEAIKSYKRAIEIKLDYAEAYNNLGVSYNKLGQSDEAVQSYKKALDIDPEYFDAYNNLGVVQKKLGQINDSIVSYKKALEINPNDADTFNNLGIAFDEHERLDDAIQSYRQALSIQPDLAEAHNNLGHTLCKLHYYKDAVKAYEKVLALKPNLDYVIGNLVNTKMNCCNWNDLESLTNEIKGKIINNEKVIEPFNLMSLIDDPHLQISAQKVRINGDYPKNNLLKKISVYKKHPKIKIGYFSADFRLHPVSYLTAELYEVHNRDQFEIHAFSFGKATNDEMNLRIKAGVDYFHDVDLMSHKEIVLFSRSLEIDIAVDLGGLTAESRTDVFAMSAAPIQLSYIGYLGSMGAEYYDYLIADPVMIPKESQKYYVEKIVYLPSFQVNDSKDLPPDIVLTRKDVGLPDNGFVFCCFNNTYKMTPTTFDSWARILQAVEGSVLIIFANNDLSKANLTKEIKKRGIDSNRLIFGDSLSRPEYLARFRVADLFLDTQPYNAGTTASDALKMGLPMLTLKGEAYQARMGASIVSALNLPELITTSSEEYESLAIELATNPEKMKSIKDKLASNLSTAPLFDTKLFTKNLESAYTEMYERYHKGLEPDHIYVES